MPKLRQIDSDIAVAARAGLGEGPRWDDRTQTLLFLDINASRVLRFDPAAGTVHGFGTSETPTAIALGDSGGLVLAHGRGFVRCGPAGEQLAAASDFKVADERVRFNDGAVDPWGRFVAGTMDLSERRPIGALYRLSSDRAVARLAHGLTISNGIGWSTDARLMYYIDSATGALDVFDLDGKGDPCVRRSLVQFDPRRDGSPDGLAIDGDGCIWVACWGGSAVRRVTPDGRVDAVVRLPVTNVTSVAFGGRHLTDLYITTARKGLDEQAQSAQSHAGDVFVSVPGVAGLPSTRIPDG
jgi:sugar lactone lactonase YvrE